MQSDSVQQETEQLATELLEVVSGLVAELHPRTARTLQVRLDSSLETDLRLDSLARVELITRLEQHFNVGLPQQIVADSESPRDLLKAVTAARGRKTVIGHSWQVAPREADVEALPFQAQTLVDVLHWHVQEHPNRLHLRVIDGEQELATLTYAELWQGAKKVAAGLQQAGAQPGDCVAIMLATGVDYFYCFYGILMAGAVPVPIYPPLRRSRIGEHLQRYSGILRNCQATVLITMAEARAVAQLLKSQVDSLREITTHSDLLVRRGSYLAPAIGTDDIAFLQYTSGSTGHPKGVVLTHANLLANIRVMGEAVEAGSRDVFVSWLPLYHDMGLIGAWLGSLYFAMVLVVMSPLDFISRPQRWLWAVHHYRATLSAAPNFGYELCLKRIGDEDSEGLDLSSWRLAFNGAEQINPTTIQRFSERFAPAGFRPQAMSPVYGLAESCVGLAFPPLEQEPRIDCVEREAFGREERAIFAPQADDNALCFVSCGRPLRGHEIRVTDKRDRELPERRIGALQFRGPSVTGGYYRNPEANANLFHGDWLDSGDLAYIAEGEVFITGRRKDIIIRGGRNLYPHELEEAVGNITGIRKGCVAAFGANDPRTGSERLIILAETAETDPAARESLQREAVTASSDLVDLPPDEVVLVPPHTVLKTSSGKIRRSACRELYERGELDKPRRAVWRQLLQAVPGALAPAWRRMRRRGVENLFAAYAWALYFPLAALAGLAVLGIPGFQRRWKILHGLARLFARLTGTRLIVSGTEHLPPAGQPGVFVANHASYLDGYVLVAALPRAFSFVAKAELGAKRWLDFLLRRMRVEYVQRFERQQVLGDAQRIARAAQQSRSLLFFPEGTFSRIPGIQDFHLGAFVTAAQANIPVVPIAVRGTRSMLRAGSWFPRRGQISIHIGPCIEPAVTPAMDEGETWQAALKLRKAAREHIVRFSGEPDIGQE
ncbi:MAG: AMP-binding protein [Thiohalophilus sp.]